MKIVVISPTYNERENIEKMIPVLEKEVFPKVKNHQMQLLIPDDNSPDGTADVIRKFMKEYKNISLIQGQKQGLGAAYVRGMKYAMDELKADAVIEFDADFQHDPHDIPRLIEAMDEGYDYVIGSRYIKGGAIPKEWGLNRKILSRFGSLFTCIVWLNFRIHDMTSGFKLTRTTYLKKVNLDHLLSKDFAYKLNILHDIIKLGAKVKEIPIVFYERTEGASKISQKDQIDSLYVVLRLRFRDSEKFLKFLVVGGVGFIINAVLLKVLVDGAHWNPSVANLVGAAAAIFSNYNFNNFWTFKAHQVRTVPEYLFKLVQFYLTSAFGVIFIQTGAIFIGDTLIGKKFYFEYFLVGTLLLLIWNFTIYNRFIWKKK
ncbi:MAG TPA: glycosyltransferase [Patescibacteria group bacterium]|nr:glycosyltransferase [Patescibacteria group bacterium]